MRDWLHRLKRGNHPKPQGYGRPVTVPQSDPRVARPKPEPVGSRGRLST